MKRILLILMTMVMLLAVAACAKKPAKDPNAVLTDSAVPLDLGAELEETVSKAESEPAQ